MLVCPTGVAVNLPPIRGLWIEVKRTEVLWSLPSTRAIAAAPRLINCSGHCLGWTCSLPPLLLMQITVIHYCSHRLGTGTRLIVMSLIFIPPLVPPGLAHVIVVAPRCAVFIPPSPLALVLALAHPINPA